MSTDEHGLKEDGGIPSEPRECVRCGTALVVFIANDFRALLSHQDIRWCSVCGALCVQDKSLFGDSQPAWLIPAAATRLTEEMIHETPTAK